MPFRDDYEALVAHVESLERQLEGALKDRARVERELQRARAKLERAPKKRHAPRDEARPEKPRRSGFGGFGRTVRYVLDQWWGNMLLLVVGAAGLLGGYAWYSNHVEQVADASDPGDLLGVRVAPLEDGSNALVLLEVVVHPGGEDPNWRRPRVDIVDMTDGRRRARVSAEGLETCASAGKGRLWCASSTGLELRETATLRVVASHEQIVARNPAFAAKRGDPCVDALTGEAWKMLDDGRFLRTDPRTLAGVTEEQPPQQPKCRSMALSTVGPTSSISVDDESVQPAGGPRSVLQIEGRDHVSRPLASEAFLNPQFLVDPASRPILLGAGHVFVVVSHESLDEHAPLVLTAMGTDGARRWTRVIDTGTIALAWLTGDRVVIAVRAKESYVLAVGAADGRVIWKYST